MRSGSNALRLIATYTVGNVFAELINTFETCSLGQITERLLAVNLGRAARDPASSNIFRLKILEKPRLCRRCCASGASFAQRER
jgi:hypothetical protein